MKTRFCALSTHETHHTITSAPQAYGSGDCELVRLWSLRGAIVLSGVMVPAFFMLYYAAPVMIHLFGLPVPLCEQAEVYVQWLIPGTYFWALYLCLQKFQQSQNVMVGGGWLSLCFGVWFFVAVRSMQNSVRSRKLVGSTSLCVILVAPTHFWDRCRPCSARCWRMA